MDVKPATREVWRKLSRKSYRVFRRATRLANDRRTGGRRFQAVPAKKKLSATTIAKRLQFARQFFKAAVKRKLIAVNPFADVAGKAVPKTDRQRFVTQEETGRLLAACPNVDWRAIVPYRGSAACGARAKS